MEFCKWRSMTEFHGNLSTFPGILYRFYDRILYRFPASIRFRKSPTAFEITVEEGFTSNVVPEDNDVPVIQTHRSSFLVNCR